MTPIQSASSANSSRERTQDEAGGREGAELTEEFETAQSKLTAYPVINRGNIIYNIKSIVITVINYFRTLGFMLVFYLCWGIASSLAFWTIIDCNIRDYETAIGTYIITINTFVILFSVCKILAIYGLARMENINRKISKTVFILLTLLYIFAYIYNLNITVVWVILNIISCIYCILVAMIITIYYYKYDQNIEDKYKNILS